MDNLNITERNLQNVTILDLVGKIRLGGGNVELRKTLNLLISEGKINIILNLGGVTHIDSSGLGELVAGYVSLQKIGGELKLLNLNSRVREIMIMVKLLTIFADFDDEEKAVRSFQPNELKQSEIGTEKLEQTNLAQKVGLF